MRLDKKKIKKFQKISVWILFLCVMILMFLIGAAFGDGEEDAFSELMLSLVIPAAIVALVDLIAMFAVQLIVEVKVKGLAATLRGMARDFLLCFGIAEAAGFAISLWRKEAIGIGVFKRVSGIALAAYVGSYLGRFCTLKISDE